MFRTIREDLLAMLTQVISSVQPDAEAFLSEYDVYIHTQARKQMLNARRLVHADVLDMEVDELAQKTRIKLWQAWQKQYITNPKAYISRIAHNEFISMVRQHRPIDQLTLDDDGEVYQGNVMCAFSQESLDPAEEVEQADTGRYYLHEAMEEIAALPQRQQRAMLCFLKENIDDLHTFIHECRARDIDADTLQRPTRGEELQAMRSSTTIARKKLRIKLSLCTMAS